MVGKSPKVSWNVTSRTAPFDNKRTYLIERFPAKRAVEHVLCPLLVPLRRRRMPLYGECMCQGMLRVYATKTYTIKNVELDADMISKPSVYFDLFTVDNLYNPEVSENPSMLANIDKHQMHSCSSCTLRRNRGNRQHNHP